MKKYFIAIGIILVIASVLSVISFASAKNDPVLVLQAEDGYLEGPAAVWGQKVGNIGFCGGSVEGTITYYDLDLPKDDKYTMLIHYYSGSDDRNFVFTVDGEPTRLDCPSTGSFDTVGTILMDIDLKKGSTLKIGTDWYGPDLDKIEIYKKGAFDFVDRVYTNTDNKYFSSDKYFVSTDLNNGVYTIGITNKDQNRCIIENAHSEFIFDGRIISSDDFTNHKVSETKKDGSTVISFEHTGHGSFKGAIIDEITFNEKYITVKTVINSDNVLSTNYISPLSVYSNSLHFDDSNFLKMPFDNDMWVEPTFIHQSLLGHTTTSYEVAAIIGSEDDAISLVCGSLCHDTWKTGIDINAEEGAIKGFNIYGGAADSGTRDKYSHGYVSGKKIESPVMFLSVGHDWRSELDLFASANAALQPPKASVEDVPFGFNSWGSLGINVNYGDMIAITDYIEKYLSDSWKIDGAPVYVNLDSYWDYIHLNDLDCDMSIDDALKAFVVKCNENGHKAGIYFTPFATWLSNEDELLNTVMEGSDYTFYDAALKNPDGSGIYGTLDGGYALDPTHPGTVDRIKDRFNYFIDLGFEYVKLDFTTHGALEGDHYLDEITTGIQAYNYGMNLINEICKGKMFVNLSISPVFPYHYADGRRISCDAFASIENTKHVLSYLDACFWQSKLYAYPDPDHLIVTGVGENVAKIRVTSGVICGTSFIIGDNLSYIKEGSADHKRILKMYGNKDIISVAKLGAMFHPLNSFSDDGIKIYVHEGNDGIYLAVFNFGASTSYEYELEDNSIVPLGIKELWSGNEYSLEDGVLCFDIGYEDAMVFRIATKEISEPTAEPTDDPVTDVTTEGTTTPDDTQALPSTQEDNDKEKDPFNWIIYTVIALSVIIVGAGIAVLIIRKKK